MNALENHCEDKYTPKKHKQDVKLQELQQLIEIAESRCGTLTEQLNYVRNLYQDSHMESTSEQKLQSNKDHVKKKGKNKNKPRNLSTELPLKKKKLRLNSACSNKSNPRQYTKKDAFILKAKNVMSNMTNFDMVGPCGECPRSVSHEFPIKEVNLQTRPVSADSRPLSMHSNAVSVYSRSSSTHGNLQVKPTSLEITSSFLEDEEISLDGENKLESTSSAVHVIQDILCGITKSVNRISELNEFINEGERECFRGEDNLNVFYNNEDVEPKIRELRDDDNDDNVEDEESNSSNKQLDNIKQLHDSIQIDRHQRRKGKQSRAGKHDIPPKLISTRRTTKSTESLRGSKRKAKVHSKKKESKLKSIGSPQRHIRKKTKLNDDNILVTTKIKKKWNPQLQNCTSKSTNIGYSVSDHHKISNKTTHNINKDSHASIPYQACHRENLVELYRNSLTQADTSASDDTFTRFSRLSNSQENPQSESYPQWKESEQNIQEKQKQDNDDDDDDDGYHISEDSADDMINENMTENYAEPIPNDERLQRVLERHLREQKSTFSSENVDNSNLSTDCQDNISKTKNFQLPTVSSKLKRVDRNFFNTLNFHNIPFVAGTSTTRSHNLGLNIQEVLSIIKMRQPMGNYVPEILNHIKQNQVPDTIQREYSHISQKILNPNINLSGKCSHISHRTTIPKTDLPEIPEKDGSNTITEECNDEICPTSNSITTIPSCHRENIDANNSQTNQESSTLEQRNFENKATKSNFNYHSLPTQQYVNYQKILNQYLDSGEKLSFLKTSHLSQGYNPYKVKAQSLRSRFSMSNTTQTKAQSMLNAEKTDADPKDPEYFVHLQGKATAFKDIFANLYEDFKRLNSNYEQLQTGVTQDSIDELEAIKQLDVIETELLEKEEEITVVMALYKEVVSLKEQVRALKEHANLTNSKKQPTTKLKPRYIIPREPTIAVRLTKLLRTIQQFQEKLRHN